MASNVEERVFVYGSLLRGMQNHSILESARLIDGNARTAEEYVMVFGGEGAEGGLHGVYPYVLEEGRPSDTRGRVRGEVYGVSSKLLGKLDELEDHPVEYRRRLTPVVGHPEPAWLYVFEEPETVEDIRGDVTYDTFVPVRRLDWRAHYEKMNNRRGRGTLRPWVVSLAAIAVVTTFLLTKPRK
ncbi:hypothetical protein CTAYLR_005447 [Chrysophaeum taylorii]|uniref:Gamma-glutamylcyclotransferase family protein n=1 Tax=Chrysophaeum taylorii TaxID=2483200 RepID=A0AAD7ULB0_9STRA|nr:hypothetical protein CTAYLR_005447 [Chrysophaeum taylorii]